MTVFFDIETLNVIDRRFAHPAGFRELGMACGCVLEDGRMTVYTEGGENALIKQLMQADKIIGHNALGFDYHVLEPFGLKLVDVVPKTIDTFRILYKATIGARPDKQGCYISLDDLARLNLGMKKTMSGKDAPAMWRDGERDKVIHYCKNDVRMLAEIYALGKQQPLKYTLKHYGKPLGIKEVKVKW